MVKLLLIIKTSILNSTNTLINSTSLNAGTADINLGSVTGNNATHSFSAIASGTITLNEAITHAGNIILNHDQDFNNATTDIAGTILVNTNSNTISSSNGSVFIGDIASSTGLELDLNIQAGNDIAVQGIGSNALPFSTVNLTSNGSGSIVLEDAIIASSDVNINATLGDLVVTNTGSIVSDEGDINVTATDVDIEGNFTATDITFTASNGNSLFVIGNTNVYQGDDAFLLDNIELANIAITDRVNGRLNLNAEDLIFFAGTISSNTRDLIDSTIASNIVATTSNDTGRVFIGGTPEITGGGTFFEEPNNPITFSGDFAASTGNLHVDNLEAIADEIFIFGMITTDADLSFTANSSLFLSNSPFEEITGVTLTPISEFETFGTLTLAAGEAVRLSGDLEINAAQSLNLAGLNIIAADNAGLPTNITIDAGALVTLGDLGINSEDPTDISPIDSITVTHGGSLTGAIILNGDVYTNDEIDFSASQSISASNASVLNSQNGPISLTNITDNDENTSVSLEITAGGSSDISITSISNETGNFDISATGDGNVDIASINSNEAVVNLTALGGTINYSGAQISTGALTISGDLIATADTGLEILSDSASFSGSFSTLGESINLSNAAAGETGVIIENSWSVSAPQVILAGNIQSNNADVNIDLEGVDVIGLNSDTSITLGENGIINLASDDTDRFLASGNASRSLNLATGSGGQVNLGTISTLSELTVSSDTIALQGNLSTSLNLNLVSDTAITNPNSLDTIVLSSTNLNLGGTFNPSVNGAYNLQVSNSINATSDLNLSGINLTEITDSASGIALSSGQNTITLGSVSGTSLDLIGSDQVTQNNFVLSSNLTTFGEAGITLRNADVSLENDVNIISSINAVGSSVTLDANSQIDTNTASLEITATSIQMENGSTITSSGGNITFTSEAGNIALGQLIVEATITEEGVSDDGNIFLTASDSVVSSFDTLENLLDAVDQVNIDAARLTINSAGIGVSSVEPLVINVDNQVNLNFTDDVAYVINLGDTNINTSGTIIDVIRDRIGASNEGQATALIAFTEDYDYSEYTEPQVSVVKVLSSDSSETQDTSGGLSIASFVPEVPNLIRTKRGWEFVLADFRRNQNKNEDDEEHTRKREIKTKKRVEWLLGD